MFASPQLPVLPAKTSSARAMLCTPQGSAVQHSLAWLHPGSLAALSRVLALLYG